MSAQAGVYSKERGQPVLLPYGFMGKGLWRWVDSERVAWKEIESGVGMCAYVERGESQGLK